jgi:hypothetical protein
MLRVLLLLCLFQPELTSRSEYAGHPSSNPELLIEVVLWVCGGTRVYDVTPFIGRNALALSAASKFRSSAQPYVHHA